MKSMTEVEIIRIFLGESARKDARPIYQLIIEEARKRGMAGATVTRGFMGFGANSLVHTAKILRLSEDLPIVVEIVDIPNRIADFLPVLDGIVDEGTILVIKGRAAMHCPMRIRDIMVSEAFTVETGTPLSGIVQLLLHKGVKAVPVTDKNKIAGIITGGDLLRQGGMKLRLSLQNQLPPEMQAEQIRLLDTAGLMAGDIMTSPVQTINVKTNVSQALGRMAEMDIKRLPVVDDDGNLLGMVSRVDILRAITRAASITEEIPELPKGLGKTAGEIMNQKVVKVFLETPLTEVLEKIMATPLRRVVVVDQDLRVLGIILDRDVVRYLAKLQKPGLFRSLIKALSIPRDRVEQLSGSAEDIMEKNVFSVYRDTPLSSVMGLMLDKGVKRLVVVDYDNRLLGMVDRDTIMKALAETYPGD